MLHKTIADAIRERMIVLDGVDPLEDDDNGEPVVDYSSPVDCDE